MSESSPHGFKGLDRIFDTATAAGARPDWMESLKPKIIIEPPTSPSTPKAAKQAKLAWHGDGAVENEEDTSSPAGSHLMASIGKQTLLAKKPTPKHAPGAFKPSANTHTIPDPKVKQEKEAQATRQAEDAEAPKHAKEDQERKDAKRDAKGQKKAPKQAKEGKEDPEKPKEEAKQPKLRPTVSEEEAEAFWNGILGGLDPRQQEEAEAGPKVEGGIDLATMKAGEAPEVKVGALPASTASDERPKLKAGAHLAPMEPEGEELKLDEEAPVPTGPSWPPNADAVGSFTENLHSILAEWQPSPIDMELVRQPTYEDLQAALILTCRGRTRTRLEMFATIQYRHSEGARLMVKSCDPNESPRKLRQAGSMAFTCQLDADFYPKEAMILVAAYEYLMKAAVHFQIQHDLLSKWCRIAKAVLAP